MNYENKTVFITYFKSIKKCTIKINNNNIYCVIITKFVLENEEFLSEYNDDFKFNAWKGCRNSNATIFGNKYLRDHAHFNKDNLFQSCVGKKFLFLQKVNSCQNKLLYILKFVIKEERNVKPLIAAIHQWFLKMVKHRHDTHKIIFKTILSKIPFIYFYWHKNI